MKHKGKPYFGDFICIHCKNHVSADSLFSGVNNRNHCPYCLHSKHVDLEQAGDRLSACKSPMQPIGLTLKFTYKKYTRPDQGELMLIHHCAECGKISINRIAADDIAENIFEVYSRSLRLERMTRAELDRQGILMLQRADEEVVRTRLFGWNGGLSYTRQPLMLEGDCYPSF
jgi:DNA-directed RNA polymerase subunit RPC12/RpoP